VTQQEPVYWFVPFPGELVPRGRVPPIAHPGQLRFPINGSRPEQGLISGDIL
jgi:hypothetical protein